MTLNYCLAVLLSFAPMGWHHNPNNYLGVMMLRILAFVLLFISGSASAASFDCNKATTKVEKLICNTPSLSKADDELYVDYLQAKLVTGNSEDFKNLAKQNWKLRQNNCDIESCLLDWYTRSTVLYRNVSASKSDIKEDSVDANNYFYGNNVNLTGILVRESSGFPSLRLDDVISVSSKGGSNDADESPEYGVAVTQLAMSNDQQWKVFEGGKGKRALVTCNLYHAHTAHHKTPVVCSVVGLMTIANKGTAEVKKQSNSEIGGNKSNGRTVDDFLIDNPSLSKNIYIKKAIKEMAAGHSFEEAILSKPENTSILRAISDGMSDNGYDHARLAVRTLQESCSANMASIWGLRDDECRILSQYRE